MKLSAQVVSPVVPVITINAPPANICSGSTITLTASVNPIVINPIYQWKRNGINVGPNSSSYSASDFTNGDIVTCSLTYNGTCNSIATVVSNSVVMNVSTIVQPTVSITTTTTTVCSGASVTFTASVMNGNANPVYQWKLNGTNTGTNSNVYFTNSLTNGDIISCVYSDNTACLSSTPITSNILQMQVISISSPSVTITTPVNSICTGTQVTFTASSVNGGATPSYQWKINGVNAGTNNSLFSTAVLLDGDIVICVMTTDPALSCTVTTTAVSNNIAMTVTNTSIPAINITASDNDVCSGTVITFTAIVQNAGRLPSYQWKLNNVNAGGNTTTYSNNALRNGDQVNCVLSPGGNLCPAAPLPSNIVTMVINDLPVISVQPADTTITPGSRVQLNASVTGAISSFTWTPPNKLEDPFLLSPSTITLTSNTTYTLQVISTKGCMADAEVTIKIFRPLYMPNAFTPNGDGINDVFRIPPDVSLLLEEFSIYDRGGNKIFTTRNISKGWDGFSNGKQLNTGVYVYTVRGSNEKGSVFLKGIFTLIR